MTVEALGVDIARVRGLYPTLATGVAQLDGAFGALAPESVIRSIIATLRAAPTQPGSHSQRSQRSEASIGRARTAVADLVHGQPQDVVLGDSVAGLLWRFTTVLSGDWQLGDEIVLTRMDSDLSMDSWRYVARRRGVVVRWAEFDLETGELPAWQYEQLISKRTRIVTVPLGNPATGMLPDAAAIAAMAHQYGALVVADLGVTPTYVPLDLTQLGADLVSVAGSVFGGPTVAACVARPGLLGELADQTGKPERFDLSPLPIELLDGLTAAVDHLAGLDEQASGTRRERLTRSVTLAGAHAGALFERLDAGLREMPHVTVLGGPSRDLPVAAFTVEGRSPDDVGAHLQRRRVSVWTGPSGLDELLRAYGADEYGGAAFLGVMPHTSPGEVDQLLRAMGELARA